MIRETIDWPAMRRYFRSLPKDAQKRVLAAASPRVRRLLKGE